MENDKTIKITPIKEENGLYKLIINDYELKEIEYALDKVRRLRESSRKSMAKAKGINENSKPEPAGRKKKLTLLITK
jgi:hypothetical protein